MTPLQQIRFVIEVQEYGRWRPYRIAHFHSIHVLLDRLPSLIPGDLNPEVTGARQYRVKRIRYVEELGEIVAQLRDLEIEYTVYEKD